MKKIKIKFGNGILVHLPYKSGYVVWRCGSFGGTSSVWLHESSPTNYRNKKYEKSHLEFLNSKGLCDRIIKAAAASQQWGYMENFQRYKAYRSSFDRSKKGLI